MYHGQNITNKFIKKNQRIKLYIPKIITILCIYSSFIVHAMEKTTPAKKQLQKLLYLKTCDNKEIELSVTEAQESIPLHMFIEQFGINTKKKPLIVNYTSKEIRKFKNALQDKISQEETLNIAQRFKALHLYGKCITQYLEKDIQNIIIQQYLPVDMITHQVIKWGYTKTMLTQSDRSQLSPSNIDFDLHNDYFSITTIDYQGYKNCQLWNMKNNTLKKEFNDVKLLSKLSPYCNYMIIKTSNNKDINKLIFYDINRNRETLLQGNIQQDISCFIISNNEQFFITLPYWHNESGAITIWTIDKNNTPQQLPSNQYLSNLIAQHILFNSKNTHLFILCNDKLLLFNLAKLQAAPIISNLSLDDNLHFSLILTDDETYIAIKTNNSLQYLYNISDLTNIIDISYILKTKESTHYRDLFNKAITSKKHINKKLHFIEESTANSRNGFTSSNHGFTLFDHQDCNTILAYESGNSESYTYRGKLTPSGNDLIVVESKSMLNSKYYSLTIPYSLIRFTLMTPQKKMIIDELLKKLTIEQSLFLYSLCRKLATKKEYCIYSDSLENTALKSFNNNEQNFLLTTFPIKFL